MKKAGVLLIHGFGGNISEVRPMADFLAKRGFKTLCPKLDGHTGNRKDFAQSRYKGWIKSAEIGFKELKSECEEIIIVGFSMGGLIGVNLAAKHKVIALGTLSTPIYCLNSKRILGNIKGDVLKFFKGLCNKASDKNTYEQNSRQQKNGQRGNVNSYLQAIRVTPISAFLSFTKLLRLTKPLFGKINCPIFIAQGLKDDAVSKESAEYIYNSVSSKKKRIKYYENSSHMICSDIDSRKVFSDFKAFIDEVCDLKM